MVDPSPHPDVWRDVTANILVLAWQVGLLTVVLAVLESTSFDGRERASLPVAMGVGVGVMGGSSFLAWRLSSVRAVRLVAVLEMIASGLLLLLVPASAAASFFASH